MTDEKKKPVKKPDMCFVVKVDELSIGGICNGIKKGTVLSDAIMTNIKKDKKRFDKLVSDKTIVEEVAKPTEEPKAPVK